jgi:hypothetical protein
VLEIDFVADILWRWLFMGLSAGEESGYGEGCMLNDRRVQGVTHNVRCDWFGEWGELSIAGEAVEEVVHKWDVSGFEHRASAEEGFGDGWGRSRAGGRGWVV